MAPVDTEAAYTIATLPKPFDVERGLVQSAPIHSFRGSRKRKRHEVVVGIDGESLSIYSLQSQNIASSYALPPQTYLCCPPASVYCRQTKQSAPQRQTYAVVRDDFEAKKQRLVCFTESNEGLKEANARIQPPAKSEHKLDAGDIVRIDVLPSSSNESFEGPSGVLVTYRDGRAHCVSSDLSGTAWTSRADLSPKDARVVFTTTFPAQDALKGLLAGREDIAATVNASSETTARQLFLRLVMAGGALKLALFSVRLPNFEGLQSQRSGLTKIMEYDLPLAKMPKEDSEYDFHAASGKLYQLSGGRFTVYDLSTTVPSIQRKFGTSAEPVTNFARISSSSVIVVIGNHALVCETKFGSVQQTIPLTLARGPATPGSKRKSLDADPNPLLLSAIAYFSDLGSLVLIADTELMVAPVMDASRGAKKAKFFHTSLSDVLGSVEQSAPPKLKNQSKKKEKFETWQNEFDAAMDRDDHEEIERLVAKALRLKRTFNDEMEQDSDDVSVDVGLQSFDIENVDRRKILHILGSCFRSGSDQDIAKGVRLLVVAGTTELFKWLALTGFLTTASIRQALLQKDPGSRPSVIPGDIMVAMSRRDETFTLMFEMLALSAHWDVEEVVSSLRLLAQSFETDDPQSQTALPAQFTLGEDTPMTNGETSHSFESETLAAEKEFDHAMTTLDTGLEVRSDAFRLTLQRLHTFPPSTITNAMRSFMTQRQLIFFIHIMRIELSDGGWITRYTDSLDDEEIMASDETPENRAIKAIADVLNCAVDAIGTSGWLVGLSGEGTNAEELVSALRAEINACLEGSYEASNLETMIDELERYREIAKETRTLLREKGQEDVNGEDSLLPLGLRVEAPVLDPKGKKKEHIRAKEMNQRVGPYTFERIRF